MIVGFGYNGFPLNIDDKDPKVNWNDKEEKQKVGEFCLTKLRPCACVIANYY